MEIIPFILLALSVAFSWRQQEKSYREVTKLWTETLRENCELRMALWTVLRQQLDGAGEEWKDAQ